jgi:hypothetical protein
MSRRTEPLVISQTLARSRFGVLLIFLLALFAIYPILPHRTTGQPAIHLDVALSAVLLAGLWGVSHRKSVIGSGIALVGLSLGLAFLAHALASSALAVASLSCALVFFVVIAGTILAHVLRERDVTTDTILGGVCAYLLLCLAWALTYSIMERFAPGSFGTPGVSLFPPNEAGALLAPELIYYSLFTLTTIGPQTIHPTTGAAESWTGLEAMAGQFYVAVLIARLVGLHTSQRSGNSGS